MFDKITFMVIPADNGFLVQEYFDNRKISETWLSKLEASMLRDSLNAALSNPNVATGSMTYNA